MKRGIKHRKENFVSQADMSCVRFIFYNNYSDSYAIEFAVQRIQSTRLFLAEYTKSRIPLSVVSAFRKIRKNSIWFDRSQVFLVSGRWLVKKVASTWLQNPGFRLQAVSDCKNIPPSIDPWVAFRMQAKNKTLPKKSWQTSQRPLAQRH